MTSPMHQAQDRRVRRSMLAIRMAFAELLEEVAYADISVRQITERADVGYMTFYRHFQSKENLFAVHVAETLKDSLLPYLQGDCSRLGVGLFLFAEQHSRLLTLVLLQRHEPAARYQLLAQFDKLLLESTLIPEKRPVEFLPRELAARHLSHGLMNLVAWWLEHHRPHAPEHMGQIAQMLVIQATQEIYRYGGLHPL